MKAEKCLKMCSLWRQPCFLSTFHCNPTYIDSSTKSPFWAGVCLSHKVLLCIKWEILCKLVQFPLHNRHLLWYGYCRKAYFLVIEWACFAFGNDVCLGFSIVFYRKTLKNSLANPVLRDKIRKRTNTVALTNRTIFKVHDLAPLW